MRGIPSIRVQMAPSGALSVCCHSASTPERDQPLLNNYEAALFPIRHCFVFQTELQQTLATMLLRLDFRQGCGASEFLESGVRGCMIHHLLASSTHLPLYFQY